MFKEENNRNGKNKVVSKDSDRGKSNTTSRVNNFKKGDGVKKSTSGNKNNIGIFNYNNIEKLNKNFMYSNLKRSNCYNCNFSKSNFNFVSFRGAHFKSCDFYACTFKYAEFIGSNLKGSSFKEAIFENTIFESVNVEAVDFTDAEFKNTIFLGCDIGKLKSIDIKNPEVRIFNDMPILEISDNLNNAIKGLMEKNKYVKAARILDNKDGEINTLSIMILLENFDEEILIKGLKIVETTLEKDFCTLSYIIRLLKSYKEEGII